MRDTERILEAIEVLAQRVDNLNREVAGLRDDLRLNDVDHEASKKKLMVSNRSYTLPSLNWRKSKHGNKTRNAGIASSHTRKMLPGWYKSGS